YIHTFDRITESLFEHDRQNPTLRKIGIGHCYGSLIMDTFWDKIDPEVRRKFVLIFGPRFQLASERLKKFCLMFPSLRRMSLEIGAGTSLYEMVTLLQPLTNLVYLNLDLSI